MLAAPTLLGLVLLASGRQAAAPPAAAAPSTRSGETVPVQLVVTESTLEVDGRTAPVFAVRTVQGDSIVRARKGERLRIELANRTTLPIAMHPHGVILPNAQDGVPFVTQEPVPPGGSFTYDFVPVQAGSYFFHSHYGWELQDQLAIPLIIEPPPDRGQRPDAAPQEVVMMLTDFLFRSPPKVFESLQAPKPAADPTSAPGPMAKPDLVDVEYDAVLANGRPPSRAEIVTVQPGSRLRLRLINASSATNFAVDLGGLEGSIVAVDGEAIQPVTVRRVELPIAHRVDLLVQVPAGFTSTPITAQAEGTKLLAGLVLAAPGAIAAEVLLRAAKASGAVGAGYAQERSFRAATPLTKRPIARRVTVELTGDMSKYLWSLGETWPGGPRIAVKEGERVELSFVNRTMMSHPMHLHGHRFQVTEIDGQPIDGAVRDTVLVMPKSTVKVQFDADHPGLWMMHCHITWHEAAGMLGIVEYDGFPKPPWYLSTDTFVLPSSLPR